MRNFAIFAVAFPKDTSVFLHFSLCFLYPEKKPTPIENRARGTFATTRGDRFAASLIIHTRSLTSDVGLLIQLTTQNPPGQPSFRHHPACGTSSCPARIPVSTDLFLRVRELFLVSFLAVC